MCDKEDTVYCWYVILIDGDNAFLGVEGPFYKEAEKDAYCLPLDEDNHQVLEVPYKIPDLTCTVYIPDPEDPSVQKVVERFDSLNEFNQHINEAVIGSAEEMGILDEEETQ